ncbi:MAG: PhzF family phenazine biosynthesis protein [Solirubrobacterales bacterium]
MHVLRVFINEDGEWGNPLGVFLAGSQIPKRERPKIAAELGFSETVFVESPSNEIRIHTPRVELPFAGHPTVGTAWLLAREGVPVDFLRVPAGDLRVRTEPGAAYITADPAWAPPFTYRQLASPADVRDLKQPPGNKKNIYAWAWIDEAAGTIRARSFVPEAGIDEDEATGSAALGLCARLDRPVVIHQGHGSVIVARPVSGGLVEVGGGVSLDEVRSTRTPPERRSRS